MGKSKQLRGLDHPNRGRVGPVHPQPAPQAARHSSPVIEAVEVVAPAAATEPLPAPPVEREKLEPLEQTPELSLVVPVFNEAQNLDALIRRCLKTAEAIGKPSEIVLVDDGSSDDSAMKISAAAEQYPGKVIGVLLNRNYGQHAAVMAGFSQACGAIIVTLDADLQNPPEEIPKLVKAIEEGCDVVGTVRVPRQDSLFRRIASRIVNRAAQKSTGVIMHDYGCMLRAYRRPVVEAMLRCHERSTFIPVLANTFARKTMEIEVAHAARSDGTSKYSLWRLINLQFDLLTSMTTFPLRLLSILGAAVSAAGVGFGVLLLILRLVHGPGWAAEGVFTLFAILFIFIGAQFVAMGLLGEYIGRIYHDVRARPRYFIHQVVGGKTPPQKTAAREREMESTT